MMLSVLKNPSRYVILDKEVSVMRIAVCDDIFHSASYSHLSCSAVFIRFSENMGISTVNMTAAAMTAINSAIPKCS